MDEQILTIARTNTTGWFELKATVATADTVRPFFSVKVGQSSGIKVSSSITLYGAFDQSYHFSLNISNKNNTSNRFTALLQLIFFPAFAPEL